MALQVGELSAELSLDTANFDKKLSGAGSSLQNIGSKATSAGKGLTAGLTLPIAGVAAGALKMSTDFNASMANVASLIPGNTQRVNELKTSVQDMAVSTGKSTGDLSEGLYNVVSAFGDSADTATILEINAKAATAGLASTTDAINLTSAVTKGYGDTSAEAVQQSSDLALMTVRMGQTTFPELASSIGRVTPLAAELGVTQEELFATMATGTGVTGGAAEVSTQLRGVLQGLMQPTAGMSELLADLGYESGEAMLAEKGLQGSIEAITGAAEESGKPLGDYLGSIEAQTLALALAGPQADSFTEKLGAMGDVGGTTTDAFKEQTEGVNASGFAWSQFQAKLQVVAQRLGDELAPALLGILDAAMPLLDAILNLVDGFSNLNPTLQTVIIAVAGLLAALGPVLIVLGTIVSAIGTLMPVLAAVGGAFAAISLPVVAVVAALAAVGVAVYLAIKYWDEIKAKIQEVWGWIQTQTSVVWGNVKTFFSDTWSAISTTFTQTLDSIERTISDTWNSITSTVKSAWSGITSAITSAWESIKSAVSSAIDAVKRTIETVLNSISSYIDERLRAIEQVFSTIWNAIESVVDTVVNAIRGVIETVLNAISSYVDDRLRAIEYTFTTIWNAIESVVSTVIDTIKGIISTAIDNWIGNFNRAKDIISGVWSGLWDTASSLVSGAVSGMLTTISGFVNDAVTYFQEMPGRITSAIGNLASELLNFAQNAGSALIDGLVSSISNGVGRIGDAVSGVIDKLNPANWDIPGFSPWKVAFKHAGQMAVGDIAKGMESRTSLLGGATVNLSKEVQSTIGGTTQALKNYFNSVMSSGDALNDWLMHLPAEVRTHVRGLGQGVVGGLVPVTEAFSAAQKSLKEFETEGGKSIDIVAEKIRAGAVEKIEPAIKSVSDRVAEGAVEIIPAMGIAGEAGMDALAEAIRRGAVEKLPSAMNEVAKRISQGAIEKLPSSKGTPAPSWSGYGSLSNFEKQHVARAAEKAGIDITQYITGVTPNEVEEQTKRAVRRTAREWGTWG